MSNTHDQMIMGRFGRPHGIKGMITVNSFTEPRDNLLDYAEWKIEINGQWRVIELLQCKSQGKHILVMVKGYEERTLCEQLTNKDIAIDAALLPELDDEHFYWHELEGMKVVNLNEHDFGVVEEMMPTGANDVMVVQGERKRLIPWLMGQTIVKVDRAQKIIRVDWDSDF